MKAGRLMRCDDERVAIRGPSESPTHTGENHGTTTAFPKNNEFDTDTG